MNKRDRERFQKILTEQLSEVTDKMGEHAHRAVELSRTGTEPGDMGDNSATKVDSEVSERLADSEGNLADKIRLALDRINEGTYGTCAACEETISIERLKAKPSVSLCISCQEAKEEGRLEA